MADPQSALTLEDLEFLLGALNGIVAEWGERAGDAELREKLVSIIVALKRGNQ